MRKGFTLMEILIVMAVVAILVAVIIPSYRSIQNDAWTAKATIETRTLRDAVESYFRYNNKYPADLTELLTVRPNYLDQLPTDPWRTGTATDSKGVIYNTYGYITGFVQGAGHYYIIYSKGMDGKDDVLGNEPVGGRLILPAGSDDIVIASIPVVKQ